MTAHAVAEDLSLAHDDGRIATGEEIDRADDEQLTRLVREVNIFARTRPEQKYRLVTALRADGETVAMTGDGTNDAPALREADIGVAMGQRGTEVARAAAELILLDDNFATIVTAVRGGRRIFDNLRRAFTYLIAFHIPILLPTLIAPLAGLPLLLLPVHLIWLELIVHPIASLVFQAEVGSADLMRQPPRRRQDLVTRADLLRATTAGLVLAGAVLGLFVVQLRQGIDSAGARSAALAALIIGQLAFVLVEHAHPQSINRTVFHNKTLIVVATAVLLTLLLGIYVPVLAGVLRLTPLSPSRLGIAAAVGLAASLWQVLMPVRRRRRQPTREVADSSAS